MLSLLVILSGPIELVTRPLGDALVDQSRKYAHWVGFFWIF